MTGRHPIADPTGDRKREYLALLNELGMVAVGYRPGASDEDRLDAGHPVNGRRPSRTPRRDAAGRWAS